MAGRAIRDRLFLIGFYSPFAQPPEEEKGTGFNTTPGQSPCQPSKAYPNLPLSRLDPALMLTLFLLLLLARTVVELVLDALQYRHLRRQRGGFPEVLTPLTDKETHQRSLEYAAARLRLSGVQTLLDAGLLAVLLASGALAMVWTFLIDITGSGVVGQAICFFTTLVLLQLPALPFEAWEKFQLEARFGFNRTSPSLWLADLAKGLILSLTLGLPLLIGLIAIITHFPRWWLGAAALLFGFQLLVAVIYPSLILPLFNRLTPLPEGSLKDRLLGLAKSTGFAARAILVVDGSKRSTHANAFFSGFGRWRRIVLFDTLVQQLEPEELAAVLAHEIGHDKLGHLPQRLLLGACGTLAFFGAMGWLYAQKSFLPAFGFVAEGGPAAFLLLTFLLSGVVTFWFGPLANQWSRYHEYQADAFAATVLGNSDPLVGALRKLHQKNLSSLLPHPVWAAFHGSHPTLLERQAKLKS